MDSFDRFILWISFILSVFLLICMVEHQDEIDKLKEKLQDQNERLIVVETKMDMYGVSR